MRDLWQGRLTRAAARYGDQAPMATVCCSACRTCVTTNVLALATGAGLGAVYALGRLGRRVVARPAAGAGRETNGSCAREPYGQARRRDAPFYDGSSPSR